MSRNQVLGGMRLCLKKYVILVREKNEKETTLCGCLQVLYDFMNLVVFL